MARRYGCVLFVLAFVAGLFALVALQLRRLMNEHYRPKGHGDVTLAISPKGDKLVFNGVGDGGRDLYLLDVSSFLVTRIAKTPDYEIDPSFSPDGQWVVYAAGKPGDRADHILVRSLAANEVRQLTAEDANDSSPEFSPDGSLIVFARDKTYQWGGLAANWDQGGVICVMRADGSGLRQITREGLNAVDPQFHPDGGAILFWGVGGLYTIGIKGSQQPRQIFQRAGREAAYSPDGKHIAFSMGEYAPDHEIFLIGADGSGPRQVTDMNGGCFRPVFTVDGNRIIFFLESWPDGPTGFPRSSVWQIDINGENSQRLAEYHLFDSPLRWKPER